MMNFEPVFVEIPSLTDSIVVKLADLYYDDRMNFSYKGYHIMSEWLTSRHHGEQITDALIHRIECEIAEIQDGFYKRTGVFLRIPRN